MRHGRHPILCDLRWTQRPHGARLRQHSCGTHHCHGATFSISALTCACRMVALSTAFLPLVAARPFSGCAGRRSGITPVLPRNALRGPRGAMWRLASAVRSSTVCRCALQRLRGFCRPSAALAPHRTFPFADAFARMHHGPYFANAHCRLRLYAAVASTIRYAFTLLRALVCPPYTNC